MGTAGLSWRRLGVLLRNMPPDSMLSVKLNGPHWTVEAQLLDELAMTFLLAMGAKPKDVKPHPQRPKASLEPDPERAKQFAAARKRAAAHRSKRTVKGGVPNG